MSAESGCKAGPPPEPTHVLLAMGRTETYCAIRPYFSHQTIQLDIGEGVTALQSDLEELGTTVRFLPFR